MLSGFGYPTNEGCFRNVRVQVARLKLMEHAGNGGVLHIEPHIRTRWCVCPHLHYQRFLRQRTPRLDGHGVESRFRRLAPFSRDAASMTASVASGWSIGRVGLAPTEKRRLITAHTSSGHSGSRRWTLQFGDSRPLDQPQPAGERRQESDRAYSLPDDGAEDVDPAAS